jgi:hypothetical protein
MQSLLAWDEDCRAWMTSAELLNVPVPVCDSFQTSVPPFFNFEGDTQGRPGTREPPVQFLNICGPHFKL